MSLLRRAVEAAWNTGALRITYYYFGGSFLYSIMGPQTPFKHSFPRSEKAVLGEQHGGCLRDERRKRLAEVDMR